MAATIADRLASPHLKRLSERLIAIQAKSSMKKPEFAEFIGISGSQFRFVRRRLANPSIIMLANIAEKLELPLYELLEHDKLRDRKDLSGAEMVENIGKIVTRCYRKSGMTKEEFADTLSLSLAQLYIITEGRSNPSLLVLVKIAKRLNIGVWELLGVKPMRRGGSGHHAVVTPLIDRRSNS